MRGVSKITDHRGVLTWEGVFQIHPVPLKAALATLVEWTVEDKGRNDPKGEVLAVRSGHSNREEVEGSHTHILDP